ncbi:alpha/beta-hydrolase, partial [Aureobasidium melanogenum]
MNPWVQRHALYAHKIHSGFYHDVNKPESFGFATHQVTPFNITTPDDEVLYAWHILPLATVATNRDDLAAADPFDQTLPLKLLKEDAEARVVVNFHGNAGHVAQGWRTDTYRALTTQPHTHVFTIDYRGFGKSTGAPTEAGLITDGRALVNYVLELGIPPSRIVILGQSLGTAVATAVGLSFCDPYSELLPQPLLGDKATTQTAVFRSIILVAPFSSLPDLLLSYRIGGVIPILAPIRNSPFLVSLVSKYILDTWPTGLRLNAYVSATSVPSSHNGAGNVHILHAINDQDISYAQSEKLFAMATGREVEALGLGVKEEATNTTLQTTMAGYRCLICYPKVKDCAILNNMKLHLGATTLAGHNMGPFRCRVLGCTKRAVRDDIDTHHGTPSHAPDWFKDQALVGPLDTLAQQCEWPWKKQYAPATCEPDPLADTHGPPAAAQGQPVLLDEEEEDEETLELEEDETVQVPPATSQTSAASVQVPPAAAQDSPIIAQDPAIVDPPAEDPFAACPFTPPTNYFEEAMDEFEIRHAGETREDIEKQYEEEQELYYQ